MYLLTCHRLYVSSIRTGFSEKNVLWILERGNFFAISLVCVFILLIICNGRPLEQWPAEKMGKLIRPRLQEIKVGDAK